MGSNTNSSLLFMLKYKSINSNTTDEEIQVTPYDNLGNNFKHKVLCD